MPAKKRPAARRASKAAKRAPTKRVPRTPRPPAAKKKSATPAAAPAAAPARRSRAAAAAGTAPRSAPIAALDAAPGDAQTITYVHGIGNKPIPSILKAQWDHALFGYDLGERSRMAYWVNRDYYPVPEAGTGGGDLVELEDRPTGRGLSVREHLDSVTMEDEVSDIGETKAQRDLLAGIGRAIESDALARAARHADAIATGGAWQVRGMNATDVDVETAVRAGAVGMATVGARVLPLPETLRRWITRKLTRALLRDVNDFFFVEARRERMRESLRERLRAGGGPFVVVAHSQGSMIAWDVLSSPEFATLEVRLLVTIGSPLGLQEAQDQLKRMSGQRKLAVPAPVERWINVADPLDPVALDKSLHGEFAANAKGTRVEDVLQWNADGMRNPHSGSGYLRTPPVQRPVRDAVRRELFQPVSDFVIARDVVRGFENAGHRVRQPVLIELAEPAAATGRTLVDTRREVVERILAVAHETEERESSARRAAVRAAGSVAKAVSEAQAPPPVRDEERLRELLRLESLRRFVAADLTREEAERLAASGPGMGTSVRRVWRNAQKRALGAVALQTVQALPAHLGYRAMGEGVTWAVLDTGVNYLHPHFGDAGKSTIECRYDCTRRKELPPIDEARAMKPEDDTGIDENGHGTHVAGIIAGALEVVDSADEAGERKRPMSGVAPKARLHSYRVLNRDGEGEDAWIIKALDHIAETNERAGKLVIHGVNLSLGGPFDQSTFGCGHTPLCRELRRLWQQGVLVVLAAGNEGFQVLRTIDGTIDANMDLSIGDPANLEEAIAVGSVHAASPHTYGVSYFSSRGPTADGRQKPDVVAPGERIISCRHRFAKGAKTDKQLYVEMSGTSMAAPYVSGLLAAYLSVRQEFVGYPDRVKRLMLEQATDLKRDRFLQGAGLPNLMRMLMAT